MNPSDHFHDDELSIDDQSAIRFLSQFVPAANTLNTNQMFYHAGFTAGMESAKRSSSRLTTIAAAALVGLLAIPLSYWFGTHRGMDANGDFPVTVESRGEAEQEIVLPESAEQDVILARDLSPLVTIEPTLSVSLGKLVIPRMLVVKTPQTLTAYHGNVDWRSADEVIMRRNIVLESYEPALRSPFERSRQLYAGDLTVVHEMTHR